MSRGAQLLAQRDGQLGWYRPEAGQLWGLTPAREDWQGTLRSAPRDGWLIGRLDGQLQVARAPLGSQPAAMLVHPRTGCRYVGRATELVEHRADGELVVHPLGVAAMAWSSDLRRIYAISPAGELFVVPVASAASLARPAEDEPAVVPVTQLEAQLGPVASIAVGPAGLVVVTQSVVLGVNLRHFTVTRILEAVTIPFSLRGAAVAVDHHRTVYLADDAGVICYRGDGAGPRWCWRATAPGDAR